MGLIIKSGTTFFKKQQNEAFKIGFIYSTFDPNTTADKLVNEYGGAWKSLGARTLMGAGTITETSGTFTFNVGDTGGEVKHPLTKAEMPSHTHNQASFDENSTQRTTDAKVVAGDWTKIPRMWWNGINQQLVETVGGDTAHNNMPPYLVVNQFKRTGLYVDSSKELKFTLQDSTDTSNTETWIVEQGMTWRQAITKNMINANITSDNLITCWNSRVISLSSTNVSADDVITNSIFSF